MFAYCNNNPVNNSDCNGESAVLAILGGMAIGAIASVVSDYLVARIRGNEYSVINGFESGFTGAAIGGFMAAGLPPEAATIIGGALGTMYRGILQEDSAKTILKKTLLDVGESTVSSLLLNGVAETVQQFVGGKYVKNGPIGKTLKRFVYEPRHLDKQSLDTISSDYFWDSLQKVGNALVELLVK